MFASALKLLNICQRAPQIDMWHCWAAFSNRCHFGGHPGQGGTAHVNEQPKSYWIKKFAECGHIYDETATNNLAQMWSAKAVTPYYYENLLVFRGENRSQG